MTPAEAAALLTVAAAFDNRKPDADQARAWAMALDGLRFEDCRAAIVAHYQDSREWLMPVDVRGKVKKLRDTRIAAFGTIPLPARIDPDDTAEVQSYLLDVRRAIADGEITNPKPELEAGPLDREQAKARVKELRATLARRTPTPERTPHAHLAAPATTTEETP